jgi:ATP-dependent Lon protease
MNPIIFIDELDKISKTEHGKEIVGILTHLLDTTQNDCFQDKYFSGVDLDLSQALFVLSYNEVDQIDKILLDRIHRIKFGHLSLKDKLIICNKHVLPEVYKKMGLEGMICFEEDVLTFIIEEYTCEAGVRKLKEILFEVVGEINLDLLKTNSISEFPINITKEDIKTKYFKDKREVKIQKIHENAEVGIINGLWANDAGLGGTLPIQAKFYPASEFLHLKLTGMVGDVMTESANVALSMAWNLTPREKQEEIIKKYSNAGSKDGAICNYGIHIHFPDGSTHKNGPSGGSCLTTVVYSLLNDKKIRNEIAMTGEISLDGRITAIGGLDLKILGGIKAGVKTFLFPKENEKDYEKYREKYKDSLVNDGVSFYPVEHISKVFEKVFDE